jgi:RHS repeat-associated protein
VLVHGRTAAQPEGRRLEIRSAMVAGDYRITETRGEPCVAALPCPRANMRYRYDTKGRLAEEIQLDRQGRPLLGMRTAYDPMDRVMRISQVTYKDGKPGAERWMVRYEYGATGEQPALIAKPSVVPGLEHQMRMTYNDRGQVLSVEEGGYSPLDARGQPMAQLDQASPIRRITRYEYGRINGRSVLVAVDGPLPGPADTTRYQRDARADHLQAVHLPLGIAHRWTQRDEAGRVTQEVPADGVAVARQYLPTGEPAQWRRGAAQARANFDALLRPTRIELPGSEVQRITYFDAMKGAQGMSDGIAQAVALTSNRGQMRWLVPPVQPEASTQAQPDILDVHVPPSAAGPGSLMAAWPDSSGWVDDFGRLVALRTSETGLETRQYDERDRLVRRALADGSTWEWQRDALGRITKHTVRRPGSVAQHTRLHYEGVNLVRIEHPHEQERLAYDSLGRLSQRTLVRQAGKGLAGLHATERYDHDEADRLLAWHLPEGGSLRYEWGVGRQLKAVRHRDGRAEAVLGRTVGGWLADRLGVGQRTVIEPWPASGRGGGVKEATPHSTVAKDTPGQDIAQDAFALPALFQSEQGYRWGNGVALRWHLNARGQLARMRWDLPSQQSSWLDEWMTAWLPQARAQASQAAPAGASAADRAMAQPTNPAAPLLMQTGFDYDLLGRMRERSLEEQEGVLQRIGFAYDGRGRLLLAQPAGDETAVAQTNAMQPEYYAYGPQGRLQAARWQGQDHDWRGVDVRRDATGLPQRIGGVPGQPERVLAYSADRRLAEVRQAGTLLARYTHNTHGLRIAKTVYGPGGEAKGAQHTQYLWQGLRLVAETRSQAVSAKDAQASPAKLARRYVYAHSVPVALIDYADGAELRSDDSGIGAWFEAVWRWISADGGELRFVHANEIGTPMAVTDAKARVIWRARPTVYGVVATQTVAHTAQTPEGFALNLRLPGQYFDAETGWHDNVLRTYDPQRGEYLEPDPLGPVPNWQSGQLLTQPYAYANHNPLIHADPFGLILFAFDGTGNTNDEQWLNANDSSLSNIWQFRQLYDDGNWRYVSGVGTVHNDQQYGNIVPKDYSKGTLLGVIPGVTYEEADMGGNYSGPARIERMIRYFNDESELAEDDDMAMEVDIIGFSRGAAQARDFANRIVASTVNGYYSYKVMVNGQTQTRCQKVNFRFMGLFDTVLSTNRSDHTYNLRIPDNFTYVAQAVALNEYRGKTLSRKLPDSKGAFPLESIMQSPSRLIPKDGKTRIELGFIGAHADIGGGFGGNENDLAQVALNWMLQQAKTAGVKMLEESDNTIIAQPVIHDKSDNQYCTSGPGCSMPNGEDREVTYGNGTRTTQRQMVLPEGMNYSDTGQFINYLPAEWDAKGKIIRTPGKNNVTGTVDMKRYLEWLRGHGYDLGNLQVP